MKCLYLALQLFAFIAITGCSLLPFDSNISKDTSRENTSTSKQISGAAEENYNKAKALWQNNDTSKNPQESLNYLSTVLSLEPNYAPAYRMRGLVRAQIGNNEDAFEDITNAIRLDPSAYMYASRALVSLRTGNIKATIKDTEYATQIDANSAKAISVRGQLYQKQGKTKEACAELHKACSLGDCIALDEAKAEQICF